MHTSTKVDIASSLHICHSSGHCLIPPYLSLQWTLPPPSISVTPVDIASSLHICHSSGHCLIPSYMSLQWTLPRPSISVTPVDFVSSLHICHPSGHCLIPPYLSLQWTLSRSSISVTPVVIVSPLHIYPCVYSLIHILYLRYISMVQLSSLQILCTDTDRGPILRLTLSNCCVFYS